MNYRKDKYGNEVSILGYGCMRFTQSGGKIDFEKAEKEIMEAYHSGVNYYDTAYVYPGSEDVLGRILEKNKIRDKVKGLELENRVIFAGPTKHIEKYYCAMDMFAMPSLYEGLGMVGIEAQASGLYCFFSDQMPKDVQVTANAQFLSIQDKNLWAEKIMSVKQEIPQRETAWTAVRDAGYDVTECANDLEKIYASSI